MRKTYRVVLPVEIGGQVYQFGAAVELAEEETQGYEHALIEIVTEEANAGNS